MRGGTLGFLSRPAANTGASGGRADAQKETVSLKEANPIDEILGVLTQPGSFRQFAQIGDLLQGLNDERMAELMNRVSKLPRDERSILLPRLMAEWTRRSPQAATEWIRPNIDRFSRNPNFGAGFANGSTDLIRAWASNAPDLALENACQYADKSVAEIILHNAIMARKGKHEESFGILRSFPDGAGRTKVMASLFFVWAQYDLNAPLAAAASLPNGTERDGALAEVLSRLAKKDAALALEKYHDLEVGNRSILPILVNGAAGKDPALAAKTLARFSGDEIAEVGPILMARWADKDPAAAFAWAQEHGIPIDQQHVPSARNANSSTLWRHEVEFPRSSALQLAAEKHPDAVAAFLRSLAPGPEHDRYIQRIAFAAADQPALAAYISALPMSPLTASSQLALLRKDLPKAEEYAGQLPAGPSREAAWTQLGMYLREPLPIPPGPDRDAMLLGMSRSQPNAYEPAWVYIREISDPALRQRAFDDLAYSLAFPQPNMPHQPLSRLLDLPGVPEEYKKPWLGL